MTGCQAYLLTRLHGFDSFKAGMMGIKGISEAPQKFPVVTAKAHLDYTQALTSASCPQREDDQCQCALSAYEVHDA